jgi:hypothetical protein
LIQKLETGEYDPEWLTDDERDQIAKTLTNSFGMKENIERIKSLL